MSEPIDPVSLEMGAERTCSVIHFQKVQGGGKLKAQILSHFCTNYAHFAHIYSNEPKLYPYQK